MKSRMPKPLVNHRVRHWLSYRLLRVLTRQCRGASRPAVVEGRWCSSLGDGRSIGYERPWKELGGTKFSRKFSIQVVFTTAKEPDIDIVRWEAWRALRQLQMIAVSTRALDIQYQTYNE